MYSSLSSATHHIFFPPRLEVVDEEQNTDGFAAHARYQSPFNGFFSHQPHRPTRKAFRWIAANHGDDPLLLAIFQKRLGTRTLFLVKSPLQSTFPVAMAYFPDRLRCQRHHA